jgi:hypothetical protein
MVAKPSGDLGSKMSTCKPEPLRLARLVYSLLASCGQPTRRNATCEEFIAGAPRSLLSLGERGYANPLVTARDSVHFLSEFARIDSNKSGACSLRNKLMIARALLKSSSIPVENLGFRKCERNAVKIKSYKIRNWQKGQLKR